LSPKRGASSIIASTVEPQKVFGAPSGAAEFEIVTAADMEAAWLIGERFPDQDFSLSDRTSFALMERLHIYTAASFDDHFAIYRFGGRKSGAFEIIR
jgi:hypothetical protein